MVPEGIRGNRQEMIPRTLEPEIMDDEEEARDYDAMNHGGANARFCDDLIAFHPQFGDVLDVGTGTARIPIALCERLRDLRVLAVDLADHMLAVAGENVARAGFTDRIALQKVDAKRTGWPDGSFGVVISNTIAHHIPDPCDLLRELYRLTRPGGALFVRDLARPDDEAEVARLVALYGDPPVTPAHVRQNALFEASLRAALTLAEARECAVAVGIPVSAVTMTSDRHWSLAWVRS